VSVPIHTHRHDLAYAGAGQQQKSVGRFGGLDEQNERDYDYSVKKSELTEVMDKVGRSCALRV
jgi:hypothetical protein